VFRDAFLAALELAVEHGAALDAAALLVDRLERWIHLTERDLREKSQRSQIHPKDGDIAAVECAGRGEQGAIASQNNGERWLLFGDRVAWRAVKSGDLSSSFLVYHHVEFVRRQPLG